MMTFIRALRLAQVSGLDSLLMASRRVSGDAPGLPAGTASRVSMLGESSTRTATVGRSWGRNSSIHSGWLRRTAAAMTSISRRSSRAPTEPR